MTKNKTLTLADVNELHRVVAGITADLASAKEDVALLQRLKDAETKAERLTQALLGAEMNLASGIANNLEIEKQAAHARIRNMQINTSKPDGTATGLLSTAFTVTYEQIAYDYSSRQNLWGQIAAPNLTHLPADALAYLTEAVPEIIPAEIMALAPGDPVKAVGQYLQAMQRGYLTH